MEDVVKVASYIAERYQMESGCPIDEMKLHKLLYFTQRECIIQTDEPLFADSFEGWRYGPVMVGIRDYYRNNALNVPLSDECVDKYKSVFDSVFREYAGKSSVSLSRLSHGELAWKNARRGLDSDTNGNAKMLLEDIRKDAERVKVRRFLLRKLQETKVVV